MTAGTRLRAKFIIHPQNSGSWKPGAFDKGKMVVSSIFVFLGGFSTCFFHVMKPTVWSARVSLLAHDLNPDLGRNAEIAKSWKGRCLADA